MSIVAGDSHDSPDSSPAPLERGNEPWSSKRPDTKTFVLVNQLNEYGRESRVGLTLQDVLESERRDYHEGLARYIKARHGSVRDYADETEDRVVWEGTRACALIRPREDGDLEVTEFVAADGTTLSEPRRTVSPVSWVAGTGESESETSLRMGIAKVEPGWDDDGEDDLAPFDEPAPFTSPDYGTIGSLVLQHAGILTSIKAMDDQETDLEEQLKRLKGVHDDACREAGVVRRKIIRAMLDQANPPVPVDQIDWHYGLGPIVVVHEAGSTMLLSRAPDSNPPDTLDELHNSCVLTVLADGGRPANEGQQQ